MDFTAILRLLPVIMQAVNLARQINSDVRGSDKSLEGIVGTIQKNAPAVIDIFSKIGADLFPNLKPGEQQAAASVRLDAELVKRIQTKLNEGGATLQVDGLYGPATKAAVKGYQVKNGLEPDGWAGPLTQAKMFGK